MRPCYSRRRRREHASERARGGRCAAMTRTSSRRGRPNESSTEGRGAPSTRRRRPLAKASPRGEDPSVSLFVRTSTMPVPVERLAAWHFRPGALVRMIPPWIRARVVNPAGVAEGSRARMELRIGLMRFSWIAVHRQVTPGRSFVDEQEQGPFRSWRHAHRFLPDGNRRSRIEDHVEYEIPAGALGRLVTGPWVRSHLRRAFEFRHRRLAEDLARHAECPTAEPLRIAVTGATGLVGRELVPFLEGGGHQVRRVVRSTPDHERLEIGWNPREGRIDSRRLEGLDAVVHLAGAGIADKRWSPGRKEEIRRSRVEGTRLLAKTLASLSTPPRVLVSASAVGWYGDRGSREVDERSDRGNGFLSDVCADWERSTEEAEAAGVRVVHLRIGLVLSARGGALGTLA
ncbi:MAG: NAD-dependent epimerase/dehydratase family protein, partial [Phycisphaerae bacterium]|nr:NAD-dependent epimerase/dehydratase family protein [Phycisphaerae bacterium]